MPITWLPDPSHYPEQMTPLSATVWFEAIGHGLHEAMRELRGSFGGFEARTELGWAYEGELEVEWEPDSELPASAAMALAGRWEKELRPRVHEITNAISGLRPERPASDEAVSVLDTLWSCVLDQWKLHFLVVVPAQMATEMLADRFVEAFGERDPLAPYRLLDGVPNESTEADGELWRLAERARHLGVDDIILEYPPGLVRRRLAESCRGREFLAELGTYLLRFGGRSRWHELSLPREAERPHLTIESIRLFLESGVAPVLGRAQEALRLQEEALTRAPGLSDVLRAAKVGYALKESHVYHIDYPGLLATREVLLGFGRRLVAEGRLERIDDIWMLRREELRSSLIERGTRLRDTVLDRGAELEKGLAEGPRPYLGEPPTDSERHVVLQKFYGVGSRAGPGSLRGTGASPGVAEGPARVVATQADFGRVERGDVLVATTTTPAWTPLFPSLAALITETGGILSHAAIVAREYSLPAVVGAQQATRVIPDGTRVRVDGSTGEVSVASTPRAQDRKEG